MTTFPNRSLRILKQFVALVSTAALLGSCAPKNQTQISSDSTATTTGSSQIELLGAGSTFGYPLYSKMFSEYNKATGVKTNYQSIGSGGGIQQLMSKTIDFGASDAFLSDDQLAKAPGPIVHIPTCLGAVAITYNLPGKPVLQLTGEVIADIFLGKIKKWNDPKIAKLNPTAKLPAMDLIVIHRSEGSGTTFIFADYLSKISSEWKTKCGMGTTINWPVGLGAKGSEGVGGLVKQTPGGICYVELIYAQNNGMPMASVQNKSGKYIAPSLESTSLAADAALPTDTRVSLTDAAGAGAYPISGFTWLLLYKEQNYNSRTQDKALALIKLVYWMTHDGQKLTAPLQYAPLPQTAIKTVEDIIHSVTYDGKPLMQ